MTAHGPRGSAHGLRVVPEETAIAFVYGGSTEAVMMATPSDLEDFAAGFSLTEGIVEQPEEIKELTIVPMRDGIELRMWLAENREAAYRGRRRRLAGPSGCGLCGVESLAAAMRPGAHVDGRAVIDAATIAEAIEALCGAQQLNDATHAAHAAGLFLPGEGLVCLREDIGRHNALDKLAGALARRGLCGASGLVTITSRVSAEMVQKAALIGTPVLVAISAPTALAVRLAETANMTLVAVARGASFEVFTHPQRVARAGGPRSRRSTDAAAHAEPPLAPAAAKIQVPAPSLGS